MGPKRIALVVLAAVAVIGVVISVIAAAIAVLPRSNRYAIGAQTSYSAPTSSPSAIAASASAAPSSATADTDALPNLICPARS